MYTTDRGNGGQQGDSDTRGTPDQERFKREIMNHVTDRITRELFMNNGPRNGLG